MKPFKHYWFYPVAYVYGSRINAVRVCAGKAYSLFLGVYAMHVADTSFCDMNTFCVIKEDKEAYCMVCQHPKDTVNTCNHPDCPNWTIEGKV